MICAAVSGNVMALAQETPSAAYRIRPSEVAVPADVPVGQYRRSIRPFENWTLICDENMSARQMVCNISQVMEDQAGNVVFSWTLAANEDGKPFMLLRTPPSIEPGSSVSLKIAGRKNPVDVALDGCNETVCVGMVPVGPILREQIGKGADIGISYRTAAGKHITVTGSLRGLATALSAID